MSPRKMGAASNLRSLRGVVRGNYAAKSLERLRVIRLAPDISAAFPDEAAVNAALRGYLEGRQSQDAGSRA